MVVETKKTGKVDQVLAGKGAGKRLPAVPKSTSKPPVEDWKDFDAKAAAKMTADAIAERTRLTKEEANRIWLSLAPQVVAETKKCGYELYLKYEPDAIIKRGIIRSELKAELSEILAEKKFSEIDVSFDSLRLYIKISWQMTPEE